MVKKMIEQAENQMINKQLQDFTEVFDKTGLKMSDKYLFLGPFCCYFLNVL